jgi:hypothetical protein
MGAIIKPEYMAPRKIKDLGCLITIAHHERDLVALFQAQLHQMVPQSLRIFFQLSVCQLKIGLGRYQIDLVWILFGSFIDMVSDSSHLHPLAAIQNLKSKIQNLKSKIL